MRVIGEQYGVVVAVNVACTHHLQDMRDTVKQNGVVAVGGGGLERIAGCGITGWCGC